MNLMTNFQIIEFLYVTLANYTTYNHIIIEAAFVTKRDISKTKLNVLFV